MNPQKKKKLKKNKEMKRKNEDAPPSESRRFKLLESSPLDRSSRRRSNYFSSALAQLEERDEEYLSEHGLDSDDVSGLGAERSRVVPSWLRNLPELQQYDVLLAENDSAQAEDDEPGPELDRAPPDADVVAEQPLVRADQPAVPFSLTDRRSVGQNWYLYLLDWSYNDGKWGFACSLGNCYRRTAGSLRTDSNKPKPHRHNIMEHFKVHQRDQW